MINPRTTKQMYAPISEFDLFLECMSAQNFNTLINTTDRVIDRHKKPDARLHSICANCRVPITRDLEYELHLPAEGERWYHDDYVDVDCTGVSCQNETEDADATTAEPEVEYERRVRG